MRIALRADASATIGLGHVSRCLSLAHALTSAGANVVLVSRKLGADVKALPLANGFDWVQLPAPELQSGQPSRLGDGGPAHAGWAGVTWETDARQTIDALSDVPIDWLVVDHYAFDARWHGAVRGALACRIACIDDLADRDLAADLLIDHNVATDHAAKYRAHVAADTLILGGPRFALLGPAYARTAPYVPRERVASLGIFMGGTDAGNVTNMALHACRDVLGFAGAIEVVTTSANPHLAELRALCEKWPRTKLSIDLPDLAAFFARHDLQIGAGGGATWERCSVGAPSLAVVCAANQEQVLRPLEALEVLRTVRLDEPHRLEKLASEVEVLLNNATLRISLSSNSRRLVDGQGAARVAQSMMRLCGK